MTLSPRLLEKLACPRCKGELAYREAVDRLDCHACRLSYRITDGIPVLLIDEADPMEKRQTV
jgi:uncharacterized protein YbaR (Trm112 family)